MTTEPENNDEELDNEELDDEDQILADGEEPDGQEVDKEETDREEVDREEPEVWSDSESARLRRLEAVLFLTREALHSRKLAELARLEDGTQARTLVKRLNEHYDKAGRAFQIKGVAGGYQMMTRPQFSPWLRRLQPSPPPHQLSTPAMETLAVVAYRQPVLKAEIEVIRGVGCGELLKQLMERNLVRISGRSSELGNPYLYSTTKRFLEVFGLANLESLPRSRELRGSGLPPTDVDSGTAPHLSSHPSTPHNQSSQSTPTDPSAPNESTGYNQQEEGSP